MKEVMIEYKQLPFGSYTNVIIKNLRDDLKKVQIYIQFPTKPDLQNKLSTLPCVWRIDLMNTLKLVTVLFLFAITITIDIE